MTHITPNPALDGDYVLHSAGINWNWYCHAQVKDGYATILQEYRIHKGDGGDPETNGSYQMVENKINWDESPRPPRMILGLLINGQPVPLHEPIGRWDTHP